MTRWTGCFQGGVVDVLTWLEGNLVNLVNRVEVLKNKGRRQSSRKQYAGFFKLQKRNQSKWLSKEHQAVLV